MGVVQVFFGTAKLTPPSTQSSTCLPHAEKCVQDHTIDAIITAGEKIVVKRAELVGHVC
jgi:hypothetical protein